MQFCVSFNVWSFFYGLLFWVGGRGVKLGRVRHKGAIHRSLSSLLLLLYVSCSTFNGMEEKREGGGPKIVQYDECRSKG